MQIIRTVVASRLRPVNSLCSCCCCVGCSLSTTTGIRNWAKNSTRSATHLECGYLHWTNQAVRSLGAILTIPVPSKGLLVPSRASMPCIGGFLDWRGVYSNSQNLHKPLLSRQTVNQELRGFDWRESRRFCRARTIRCKRQQARPINRHC